MAQLEMTLLLALNLETELYGSVNSRTQESLIKGIYQKDIDVVTKIRISNKIGKTVKAIVKPYHEDSEKIKKDVQEMFASQIEDLNLQKSKTDLSTEEKDKLTSKDILLTNAYNAELNKRFDELNKNLSAPLDLKIEAEFTIDDFIIVKKDSEERNALEGNVYYETFCSNFIKLD